MDDLREERATAAEAIESIGAGPVMFETFGARSDDSRQAYKTEVRRSHIYLGILSRRYGVKQQSGYSATHAEYEEARNHHKELLLFLDDAVPRKEREGHLNSWIDELYQQHVLAKYKGLDELAQQINTSLVELARKQITPWVKLSQFVFQATRITQTTESQETVVEIATATEDPQVISKINQIAHQQPFGSVQTRLTFRQRSYPVEVMSVEETIDPLGNDSLTIACKRGERRHQRSSASMISMLGGGYSTGSEHYSQEDLIRLALGKLVFGEDLPRRVSLAADIPDLGLEALYGQFRDDPEVFVNVMRLLIVEAISEQGLVDQLVHLNIEQVQRARVHVELSATLPQRYADEDPDAIGVEGEIDFR